MLQRPSAEVVALSAIRRKRGMVASTVSCHGLPVGVELWRDGDFEC